MKRLQVLKDQKWEYVFCYMPTGELKTTKDRKKALLKRDQEFFANKYGNDVFRSI